MEPSLLHDSDPLCWCYCKRHIMTPAVARGANNQHAGPLRVAVETMNQEAGHAVFSCGDYRASVSWPVSGRVHMYVPLPVVS
ncbi:hypothetical protein HZ326_18574 [Fusarium oxysporum f. sp. albedinis]|nr:hypothetical protein HZ326_18574 [Fusarium oxysporum f. sp. albedinis]